MDQEITQQPLQPDIPVKEWPVLSSNTPTPTKPADPVDPEVFVCKVYKSLDADNLGMPVYMYEKLVTPQEMEVLEADLETLMDKYDDVPEDEG